jgi:dCMP deaminase
MTISKACHATDKVHNNGPNLMLEEAAQGCTDLTSDAERNKPSSFPDSTTEYSTRSENSSFTEYPPMKLVDTTQDCPSKSSESAFKMATVPMSCRETVGNLLWEEARYRKSSAHDVSKRKDYLTWDDYFMAIAMLSAHRSKDPDNATGACIVDASNRVIGIGYSGFPAGADDDVLPWTNRSPSGAWLHTKSPYLIPAPINAILNKCAADCSGARLYTPTFPCNECAKIIIQARIGEVIYLEKDVHDCDSIRASRILLSMANVRVRQYRPEKQELMLDFSKVLSEMDLRSVPVDGASHGERNKYPRPLVHEFRDLLLKEANYDPLNEVSCKRLNSLSWDDCKSVCFSVGNRSLFHPLV